MSCSSPFYVNDRAPDFEHLIQAKMWSRPSAALVSLLLPAAFAVDTVVDLGYQSYEGVSSDSGVTQWLGMRYAAPPLGDLRFAAPMDPEEGDGDVVSADAVCIANRQFLENYASNNL